MKIRGIFCVIFILLSGVFAVVEHVISSPDSAEIEPISEEDAAAVVVTPGIAVDQALEAFALSASSIRRAEVAGEGGHVVQVRRIQVAGDLPLAHVNQSLTRALSDADFTVFSGVESSSANSLTLRIGTEGIVTDSLVFQVNRRAKHAKGRIAIVIDDLEADTELLRAYLRFPDNLTMAVIPGWPASADVATMAVLAGKEVIVHLPMETEEPPLRDEPLRLMTGMERARVQQIVNQTLDDLPMVVGINNHEGSKGTSDKSLMEHLSQAMRGKKLYFLDSATSAKSEALRVMQRAKNPVVRRDIFLDHDETQAAVEAQLAEVCKLAAEKGSAIAIGHVTKAVTLDVLQQALPRLYDQGFSLVFVSELL